MKACVETFEAGLKDLSSFLVNADRETELVKSLHSAERQPALTENEKHLVAEIVEAGTAKKQYVYAVTIIGLYGLLERFVDNVIERYVEIICSLVDHYDALPEAMRKNHVPLSMDLLKAVNEERHRGDLTVAQIISNLNSCLSDTGAFQMNRAAFVLHRGNIKLGKVRDFLTALDIDASFRRILVMPTFVRFFEQADPPRDARGVQDNDLLLMLAPIDDLVDQRNLIAHGIIDDIENVDLLMERCRFVTAFVHAIHELLEQEIMRATLAKGNMQVLGRPIVVYDSRIVCFETDCCQISVGDVLVASTGDALLPFRSGNVITLQVNNQPITELDITTTTKFGAEVTFKAKDTHDYFVLRPAI